MSDKKYTGFYNIVKNEATKEATIFIYGVIGGFDWETFNYINTSNKFVKEFNEIEKTSDVIHIRINSPGGSVYDGMPIYNAIKNSKKTIYTYVDGLAASMASLIALAGDKVYGYRNSIFMVHNVSTINFGNSSEFRQTANELDIYDKALGTIIEDKLGISESEVSEKYLNYKDNYFTGEQALSEGFFDEIIKEVKTDVPEDIANMSHQNLIKHYSKMNFAEEKPIETSQKPNNMSKEINAPKIMNFLGYETPFQSNENGVFLQEAEIETIETALANSENAVVNANEALATIIAEKNTISQTVTDANTIVDAALTTAEISFTLEMSLTEKITLLENQRKEFASKSAGGRTTLVNDADDTITGDNKQVVYAHDEEAMKILNLK